MQKDKIFYNINIDNQYNNVNRTSQFNPIFRSPGFSIKPATAKLENVLPKQGPILLNLGCGRDVRAGFINIDLFSDHPQVVNMDIRKLEFADNTVDFILASDVLEHFSHYQTDSLLKE